MSVASERKAMRDLLPTYSLLTIPQFARFLGCSEDTAREMVDDGVVPSVRVGKRRHIDPIDAIVHVLADREGVTAADYWRIHGEATADHARRFIVRVRKVQAA